jgi:hypothetical protein
LAILHKAETFKLVWLTEKYILGYALRLISIRQEKVETHNSQKPKSLSSSKEREIQESQTHTNSFKKAYEHTIIKVGIAFSNKKLVFNSH